MENEAHEPAEGPDDEPEEEESLEAERDASSGVERVLRHGFFSKVCPECRQRFLFSDDVCPDCECDLRNASLTLTRPTGGPLSLLSTGSPEDAWDTLYALSEETGFSGWSSDEEGPETDFAPGRVLGSRWRIVESKGGGYFGRFYVGEHVILGMRVGIKVLRRRFHSVRDGRKRFYEEAMRLSRFNHPNIVKVLDYGEEDDQPYLILEYLSGRPLHEWIQDGLISVEEGVAAVRDVALALSLAHAGGAACARPPGGEGPAIFPPSDENSARAPLVHLDLKPDHLFLERIRDAFHVTVIDFGIAEIDSTLAESNGSSDTGGTPRKCVAGTPAYMAPEQWDGVVSPKCDLYALGVVLYELVARRLPFKADSTAVMERVVKTATPTPPSQHAPRGAKLRPRLPGLDRIILDCLEKAPEERPASAEVLARRLTRWLEETPVPRAQRALRTAVVTLAAVPVVLLLLLLALFAFSPGKVTAIPDGSGILSPKAGWSTHASAEGLIRSLPIHWGLCLEQGDARWVVPLEQHDPERSPGELSASWDRLPQDLRERDLGGAWKARVTARTLLGREVLSERLDGFRIDDRGPSVQSVDLDESLHLDGTTLWVLSRRGAAPPPVLRISADEDLDPGGSYLAVTLADRKHDRVDPMPGDSGDRRPVVTFALPLEATEAYFVLADVAGNETTSKQDAWEVRVVEMPRIVLENPRVGDTVYTNQNPCVLRFRIEGTSGEPMTQERVVHFGPDTPQQEVRHRVPCANGLWVAEEQVTVRYLQRALQIDPNPSGGSQRLSLATFRGVQVRDDEGRDVTGDTIQWTTYIEVNRRPLDTELQVTARGLFDPPLTELVGDESGKVTVIVLAQDPYGNKSNPGQWAFGKDPERPRVTIQDVRGGSRSDATKLVLLNEACPLRRISTDTRSDELVVTAQCRYDEREAVIWMLCVGDPEPSSPLDRLTPWVTVGKEDTVTLTVPFSELYKRLKEGDDNEVYVVAQDQDPAFADLRGYDSVTIHYCDAFELQVDPSDAQPIADSSIDLRIRAHGGPPIRSVVVSGPSAESSKTASHDPGAPDLWTVEGLEIAPAGITQARVLIDFEGSGGPEDVLDLRYCRAPEEGIPYAFTVANVGSIRLWYHKGERVRFYYTTLKGGEALARAYRASLGSGVGSRASRRSPARVTFTEAEGIASWVAGRLQSAGYIQDASSVGLPTRSDLESLYRSMGSDPDVTAVLGPPELSSEWVSSQEADRSGLTRLGALIALRSGLKQILFDGAEPDDDGDRHGFRLIVTAASNLHPGQASNVPTPTKRSLPRSDS